MCVCDGRSKKVSKDKRFWIYLRHTVTYTLDYAWIYNPHIYIYIYYAYILAYMSLCVDFHLGLDLMIWRAVVAGSELCSGFGRRRQQRGQDAERSRPLCLPKWAGAWCWISQNMGIWLLKHNAMKWERRCTLMHHDGQNPLSNRLGSAASMHLSHRSRTQEGSEINSKPELLCSQHIVSPSDT